MQMFQNPMILTFILAACGIILIAVAVILISRRAPDPLDRLRPRKGVPGKETSRRALRQAAGSDRLDRYAGFLEPKNKKEMSETRAWLQRAGYRSPSAVRSFHAIQFAGGIGCLLLGLGWVVLGQSADAEPSPMVTLLAVLGPGLFGYYAPRRWVDSRATARTQEIQDGFPDALDMLLVCVEAGQSLDQGIIRVAREMETSCPALAEELDTVANEVKAGLDRATVLRAFGVRTAVPDVISFVTVMIQSQQFGTSIAEALRLYASDMRDKRIMRAEEAANKIPTKMTLGTMLFTVPPLLIILIGPSIHGMLENFAQMGVNGQ